MTKNKIQYEQTQSYKNLRQKLKDRKEMFVTIHPRNAYRAAFPYHLWLPFRY